MDEFEKILREREQKDNEEFSNSLYSIGDSIMTDDLVDALNDFDKAQNAIDSILRFYYIKRKKIEIPPNLTNLYDQLEYYLRPYGIPRRVVKLDEGWYKKSVYPFLGTLRDTGDIVALLPNFSGRGYYYKDYNTGKKVNVNRKTAQNINNEAVALYARLPAKSLKIRDLVKFILSLMFYSDIVWLLIVMGITTFLGMLQPLFMNILFGDALTGANVVIYSLAAYMISVAVAKLLMSIFQSFLNNKISIVLNSSIQAAITTRLMNLPVKFFRDYSSGEITSRAGNVLSLCNILTSNIAMTVLTSLFSLLYVGQIFNYAPSLVVPALLIILATLIVTIINTFAQMRITKERMLTSSKTYGLSYATISGIQKIKYAGAEKRMFARWAKLYSKESALSYNPPFYLKISGTIILAISLIGTLALYYSAVKNNVAPADYFAFTAAYGMVSGAFMSFASVATSVASIKPTFDLAKPILEAVPETTEDKEIIHQLDGNIDVEHVSFKYKEGAVDVLKDLNLSIKKNEYVAIVGRTGCGKSTLVRLLLGFDSPQVGTISYDGKNINSLDLKSLRSNIGTVLQDNKLLMGDIYSNIVITNPKLTLDDAWRVAEMANIAEDIREMPMGMHTLISEGQGGISGGQKQRLMIARALANSPKILIFDEATSALDNVSQEKISKSIDELNCTRIVIAHRLSTIKNCDRILYLGDGTIQEEGTYQELIEKDGLFADLVKHQRLDLDEDEEQETKKDTKKTTKQTKKQETKKDTKKTAKQTKKQETKKDTKKTTKQTKKAK